MTEKQNPYRVAQWPEIHALAVAQVGKFAVYISNDLTYDGDDEIVWDFVKKSLSNLYGEGTTEARDVMVDLLYGGLFFFETEVLACQFYEIFEGEPAYASGIYASLISPTQGNLTENT